MQAVSLPLDDRKEIWTLLDRIGPQARIDFLKECCLATPPIIGENRICVTSHTGYTTEAYYDLMQLEIHGLDLNRAVLRLVEIARKQRS